MKTRLSFFVLTAGALFLVAGAPVFAAAAADDQQGPAAQAAALADKGNFEPALPLWQAALDSAQDQKDVHAQLSTSIGFADSLHQLGENAHAEDLLEKADKLAKTVPEKALQCRIETLLGEIYMLSTNPDDSQGLLKKAVDLAKQTGDQNLIASATNNLANYDSYQKNYNTAFDEYQSGIEAARKAGNASLALKIEANYVASATQAESWGEVEDGANKILSEAPGLPDTHEKAMALIGAGRGFLADDDLRMKAFHCYQEAEKTATALQDDRALSYALGYEGELYKLEGKNDDALLLSRHAAILAQGAKSPDILFRWQWQIAKILNTQHQREDAIVAYQSAITTLQSIRHDLSLHYGNINYHSSFREAAGAIYFELADLLLQRADDAKSDADVQAILVEARGTVEELKTAELEDYFQDDCANILKAHVTSIEKISAGALVVYFIPLADRTEILVSTPSGRIERIKSPATADQLETTATTFRYNLENRGSYEFLDQATQLYDWLIRPLQPLIDKTKIDTLVFVPDGALRTIPMSALYDGEHFLVEKYAIATTPGLTLMDAKPLVATKTSMMVNALTESRQGFDALTYVKDEASNLKALYKGSELMNANFNKSNVSKEFTQDSYSIVHIASHGHFDSDVRKTFILTYDGKLSLDEMEQMIRPSQLRDQPVELLTLSACQTAAGDDRAALGLAGVAVKAGARSAFATLWFVNDEASSMVVSDFYKNLHDKTGITKAKALQQAQVKLLNDPRYGHPCYWAPYLIIGNWL
jgi:CHAT domain-containing protein